MSIRFQILENITQMIRNLWLIYKKNALLNKEKAFDKIQIKQLRYFTII